MNRVCDSLGAALVAGLCMTFAQPTTVLAGGCDGDCGSGDLAEGEECAGDDYVDNFNAGCNEDPNNFIDIGNGGSICGSVSNYLAVGECDDDDDCADGEVCVDGTCIQNQRDTDWYRLDQASMMNQDKDGDGRVSIQTSLSSEFDGATFIIDINNCGAPIIIGDIGFSGAGCAGGEASGACVQWADHPNGIAIWVSTANTDGSPIFEGFECGSGLNDYTIDVSVTDFPDGVCPDPICGEKGTGACNDANGTPGCDDAACCGLVCDLEPLCCAFEWDNVCVTLANDLCSIAPICEAGGDTELTESVSLDITPLNSIACSLNDATTVANRYGRVYDLAAIMPGQGLSVTCVGWGIEINSANVDVTATVNVYTDTDADPGAGLVLQGSTELLIAGLTSEAILQANFDPPVEIPADTFMVVELDVPDLGGITGVFAGSNANGQNSPSYIAAPDCGATVLTDLAALDFPNMHLVNTVTGNTEGGGCVGDIDGDNDVDPSDLVLLLGSWSVDPDSCPGCPADLDGDDDVDGSDLVLLLGAWGPCP